MKNIKSSEHKKYLPNPLAVSQKGGDGLGTFLCEKSF